MTSDERTLTSDTVLGSDLYGDGTEVSDVLRKELSCKLSTEEQEERRHQVLDLLDAKDAVVADHAERKATMKAEMGEVDGKIAKARAQAHSGTATRAVICHAVHDFKRSVVFEMRTDTREMVANTMRPMTAAERQRSLVTDTDPTSYDEGSASAELGLGLDENPSPAGSAKSIAWAKGWSEWTDAGDSTAFALTVKLLEAVGGDEEKALNVVEAFKSGNTGKASSLLRSYGAQHVQEILSSIGTDEAAEPASGKALIVKVEGKTFRMIGNPDDGEWVSEDGDLVIDAGDTGVDWTLVDEDSVVVDRDDDTKPASVDTDDDTDAADDDVEDEGPPDDDDDDGKDW